MNSAGLLLVLVLGMFMLLTNASAACTVGAKDCRHTSPGSAACFWWYCEQTGSETTWIFKGISCTCPNQQKSSLDFLTPSAGDRCEKEDDGLTITEAQ